jgi:hypothetical protein
MALDIDESRFPLIVIELHDRVTDEDAQAFMDGGVRWIGQRRPYGLVLIPRSLSLPRIEQLKPLIKWMNEHAEGLDTYHRVIAIVTDSAMLRGALKAIFKLRQLYAEQFVTKDRDEAIEWAAQRLAEIEPTD